MALRRLERKSRQEAFLKLKHFAHQFQATKIQSSIEGYLSLKVDETVLKRNEMLQRVRKALIKIQLRQGDASLQNAFI